MGHLEIKDLLDIKAEMEDPDHLADQAPRALQEIPEEKDLRVHEVTKANPDLKAPQVDQEPTALKATKEKSASQELLDLKAHKVTPETRDSLAFEGQ